MAQHTSVQLLLAALALASCAAPPNEQPLELRSTVSVRLLNGNRDYDMLPYPFQTAARRLGRLLPAASTGGRTARDSRIIVADTDSIPGVPHTGTTLFVARRDGPADTLRVLAVQDCEYLSRDGPRKAFEILARPLTPVERLRRRQQAHNKDYRH